MLLMFSPGLTPPIRLCLITFINILPTTSPAFYLTHNKRSTALAEYLYIRGRETDFMTHQNPCRKSISENSGSTSDHLLSTLFSQVLFSTIINCFGQE